MTQWLVRTSKNEIQGPFSEADLLTLIREGKWSLRDEVCRQNHYWFSFNDSLELQKQLGISWPDEFSASQDEQEEETDEISETETRTMRVDPRHAQHLDRRDDWTRDELLLISEPEVKKWWSNPGVWALIGLVLWIMIRFFFAGAQDFWGP